MYGGKGVFFFFFCGALSQIFESVQFFFLRERVFMSYEVFLSFFY
jgi:hypothetical protein